MLTKGQRVRTPYGAASIVGFERFGPDGRSQELAEEDTNPESRICVELDSESAWANGAWGNQPYLYRSEVVNL